MKQNFYLFMIKDVANEDKRKN